MKILIKKNKNKQHSATAQNTLSNPAQYPVFESNLIIPVDIGKREMGEKTGNGL